MLAWVMPMSTPRRNSTSLMFCSGPLPDHGQDAQRRAVIEHLGDVLDDGEIGAAGAAGHDRHHVLVHARAEALARLSGDGVVRLGGVLGARRRDGGAGDQTKSAQRGQYA